MKNALLVLIYNVELNYRISSIKVPVVHASLKHNSGMTEPYNSKFGSENVMIGVYAGWVILRIFLAFYGNKTNGN